MVTSQDLAELGAAVTDELGMTRERTGDPLLDEFKDHMQVTIMGAVWSRPGLDLKTRTLLCVVSDIATGRSAMLPLHARWAMRQGWTRDELVEVGLQLASYVGAPLALEGFMALRDVLATEPAEGEPIRL